MLVAATLAACGGTTYDDTISTGTVASTSTTTPVGDAAELMPRLLDEAIRLSEIIANGGEKSAAVERIDALWAAVLGEVTARRPELLGTFTSTIDMFAEAARFNRPADADKAYRNLKVLVDSFLAS